jgi:hypothetical protein
VPNGVWILAFRSCLWRLIVSISSGERRAMLQVTRCYDR